MAGMGHNGGPQTEGIAWRTHCWKTARAKLMPVLPIEVVRLRVERAKDLGLPYKTYAGLRAASGHDIIAFMFSSNTLRVTPAHTIPADLAAKLHSLRQVGRIGLAQTGQPDALITANFGILDSAGKAPRPFAPFREAVGALRTAMGKLPGDQVVLIASDAPWEREWLAAGKLGGMVSAEQFFAMAS